jgi:type VI secretion system secreted protein Hcp
MAERVTAFMKIDGIPGGATEVGHKDWCEVERFSFSLSVQQQHGSLAGGGAQVHGDVEFSNLSITKRVDKSSPELFFACCKGKVLKEIVVEQLKKLGGDQMEKVYSLKLSNALVTHYEPGADTEEVMFSGTKVEYAYTSTGPDGRTKGTVTKWWDRALNKGG